MLVLFFRVAFFMKSTRLLHLFNTCSSFNRSSNSLMFAFSMQAKSRLKFLQRPLMLSSLLTLTIISTSQRKCFSSIDRFMKPDGKLAIVDMDRARAALPSSVSGLTAEQAKFILGHVDHEPDFIVRQAQSASFQLMADYSSRFGFKENFFYIFQLKQQTRSSSSPPLRFHSLNCSFHRLGFI